MAHVLAREVVVRRVVKVQLALDPRDRGRGRARPLRRPQESDRHQQVFQDRPRLLGVVQAVDHPQKEIHLLRAVVGKHDGRLVLRDELGIEQAPLEDAAGGAEQGLVAPHPGAVGGHQVQVLPPVPGVGDREVEEVGVGGE